MRQLAVVWALVLSSAPLWAQRGQFTPPPDHWLTLDSVVQMVGVTDAQKPEVAKHYEAINAVLKKAAEERRKMREQFMAGGGPPSPEQRQAMQSAFQKFQAELDEHYGALRGLLTPEQQAKLDALPRPRVVMMGGRRQPGQEL
ncbi:hypothetical protein HRbin33_01493 [bacterium HR33]|nr:hypothetical protein HRbin33_01493 [bacterium HR33]